MWLKRSQVKVGILLKRAPFELVPWARNNGGYISGDLQKTTLKALVGFRHYYASETNVAINGSAQHQAARSAHLRHNVYMCIHMCN